MLDSHTNEIIEIPEAMQGTAPSEASPRDGEAEVQSGSDTQDTCDLRFANPHIESIVETYRRYDDVVRARARLTLQGKAICRRFHDGDKGAASKFFDAVANGKEHAPIPHEAACIMSVMPIIHASAPLTEQINKTEKLLIAMAKELPIADLVEEIKGFSYLGLAKIVGECGDLSAYKSVSAVWKRAGLAVIDGQRQRRVKDADEAERHGYSPRRRATFWTIGDNLLRSQGKEDTAGPYRKVYDARKEYELKLLEEGKLKTRGHADNRARRFVLKRLVRDLVVAWKKQKSEAFPEA